MNATEILKSLDELNVRHQAAQRAHAVASSQYEQAQGVIKKAEDELRALGVDPAEAETYVQRELARVEGEIASTEAAIGAATANYRDIDTAFRKLS
jgi:predicted  nucleic acid-binding Zn-ribbon protein